MRLILRALVASAVVPYIAACGGGEAGTAPISTPPSATATVEATPALQFTPATVSLLAGGTVTFDFGAVDHDLYFDNAPAGAPENVATPTRNASVSRTFPTAGRFVYNCHIHPGMTGTVIVQ